MEFVWFTPKTGLQAYKVPSSRGTHCVYSFIICTYSLPAGGLCCLGRGARRRPTCTHGSTLGPGRGPLSVFWGFDVAKTNILLVRDLFTPSRSLPGHSEPHNLISRCFEFSALLLYALLYHTVLPALKFGTLRQPRYNSSPTSGSSFYDGDGPCFCVVCVCMPKSLYS